jgi:hypothetical protein
MARPVKNRGLQHIVCFASLVIAACARQAPDTTAMAPVLLLFNGTGTSPNDVAALEAILQDRDLAYSTVDSAELNGMSEAQLMAYRLMIVPGGNYIVMGQHLTPHTATAIRTAVHGGLNYLGICAGGLLAGDVPDNGFNLTDGVSFGFYAAVNRGIHKAAVLVTRVDSPALEHYWEDGPEFTGWGSVVGQYPDATPAIVQGASGKGWVVLCGTHPEAPENWRHAMRFTSPVSATRACAIELISAALHGTRLPSY